MKPTTMCNLHKVYQDYLIKKHQQTQQTATIASTTFINTE